VKSERSLSDTMSGAILLAIRSSFYRMICDGYSHIFKPGLALLTCFAFEQPGPVGVLRLIYGRIFNHNSLTAQITKPIVIIYRLIPILETII